MSTGDKMTKLERRMWILAGVASVFLIVIGCVLVLRHLILTALGAP